MNDGDHAEDVRLMERVANGEAAAERELACRLVRRARRVSLALLRHEADAEDATQVALLEVLRSAKTFRGEGPVERWADRIVTRTALRIARDRRARNARDANTEPDATGASPSDAADAIDVRRYLERVAEPRRSVLVLRHVMGHSIEEVAAMTGVSVNTVKDRLLQALQQVRAMIRRDQVAAAHRGA